MNEIVSNSSNFTVCDNSGNVYTFLDLNNYMNIISSDPSVEWGTIYQQFPSGNSGLMDPIRGTVNSVDIPDIYPDAIATIHSHPSAGPPSVSDIIVTGDRAKNNEYRYSIIVNDKNSTVYTVAISDPGKAYQFSQKYSSSYDASGWLVGSEPGNIFYTTGQKLSSLDPIDRYIYSLSAVLNELDAGMVITQSNSFMPNNTTAFSVKDKNGVPQPVKCSNN